MLPITLETKIRFSTYSISNPDGQNVNVEFGEILLELQKRFQNNWFQSAPATNHLWRYGVPMEDIPYSSLAKAGYLDTAHQQTERWKQKKYYYKVKPERLKGYSPPAS